MLAQRSQIRRAARPLRSRRPLYEQREVIGGRMRYLLDTPTTFIKVPLDGCRSYVREFADCKID
jgi:hypothetical protein